MCVMLCCDVLVVVVVMCCGVCVSVVVCHNAAQYNTSHNPSPHVGACGVCGVCVVCEVCVQGVCCTPTHL